MEQPLAPIVFDSNDLGFLQLLGLGGRHLSSSSLSCLVQTSGEAVSSSWVGRRPPRVGGGNRAEVTFASLALGSDNSSWQQLVLVNGDTYRGVNNRGLTGCTETFPSRFPCHVLMPDADGEGFPLVSAEGSVYGGGGGTLSLLPGLASRASGGEVGFLLGEGHVGSCSRKPGTSSEGVVCRGRAPRELQAV